MPGDQHAIPGGHEVGLDVVGARIDRALVSGERVLGPLAAGAAMGDDQHFVRLLLRVDQAGVRRGEHQREQAGEPSHAVFTETQGMMP